MVLMKGQGRQNIFWSKTKHQHDCEKNKKKISTDKSKETPLNEKLKYVLMN